MSMWPSKLRRRCPEAPKFSVRNDIASGGLKWQCIVNCHFSSYDILRGALICLPKLEIVWPSVNKTVTAHFVFNLYEVLHISLIFISRPFDLKISCLLRVSTYTQYEMSTIVRFYRASYASTVLAVIVCPSVRPSVRLSVCLSQVRVVQK